MKKIATFFVVAAAMFGLSSCSQDLTTEENISEPPKFVVHEIDAPITTTTEATTETTTTKPVEHIEKEIAVPLINSASNLTGKTMENVTTTAVVVNTTENQKSVNSEIPDLNQKKDENILEQNNEIIGNNQYNNVNDSTWQITDQLQTMNQSETWGQTYYTVKADDCWSSIAESHGIWPPDVLAKANNATIYDTILPGDTIIIPSGYEDYSESQVDYQNNYQYDYAANQYDSYQNYYDSSQNYYDQQSASGTCIGSSWLASAPDWASWNNIQVSLSQLNGLTLYPGEYFNWDSYIGYMTADETNLEETGSNPYGYVKAPVFIGTENGYEVGGGICVTSTALFQAARDAGMSIVERHDHAKKVGYASPGDEASVSYGELNLVFANFTGSTVVFYTSCSYGGVSVSCYIV